MRLSGICSSQWVGRSREQTTSASLRASRVASSGAGAAAIAEFVFGRLVEVFRNLRGIEAMQRERAFHRPGGRTLAGKTIGIVGLGAIGSAVARLARAFDMRTIAIRRSARPGDTSPLVDALHGPEGLSALLADADVVVLCALPGAETHVDGRLVLAEPAAGDASVAVATVLKHGSRVVFARTLACERCGPGRDRG